MAKQIYYITSIVNFKLCDRYMAAGIFIKDEAVIF